MGIVDWVRVGVMCAAAFAVRENSPGIMIRWRPNRADPGDRGTRGGAVSHDSMEAGR